MRNLYAGQEATVRTGHVTKDWFQIRKGVRQVCILSPGLFNFYADFPIAQTVKNLSAMQETRVRSPSWEDPLEKRKDPLQYSCLKNPMEREDWWAIIHRVAKSQTRLKD